MNCAATLANKTPPGRDCAHPSVQCRSLFDLLDSVAIEHPTRIAVEDHFGVLTYAQLADFSRRIARRIGAQSAPICINLKRDRVWLCAVFGAIRCGAVICMSLDLQNEAEQRRNAEIIADLKPGILVGGTDDMVDIDVLPLRTIDDIVNLTAGDEAWERKPEDTIYFNYTGGSTSASKCVQISQEMACYEVKFGYPSVCQLPPTARVLQHTSCFWGASCLGQLSYWLAFQCTLVVTEDAQRDVSALKGIVNKFGVTVIGVVPSVLEALHPEECPSVDTIFTWGEALPSSIVCTWQNAKIYDLLIATEYWLCLYRKPPAQTFKVLPGVILSIRSDQQVEVEEGEVGELFLAGPMVTRLGYLKEDTAFQSFSDSHHSFYRTRDLVRMVESGLKFCGRADDYAKVGGQWVDMNDIEMKLLSFASKCAIVWDPVRRIRHICLVLLNGNAPESVWHAARICPKNSCIHVLESIPLSYPSNKVDRRALLRMISSPEPVSPGFCLDRMLKVVPNHQVATALATCFCRDYPAKLLRSWSRWWQALRVFEVATSDLFYVLHKISHDDGTSQLFSEFCDKLPFHFLGLIHLIRRRMPFLETILRIHRPRRRSWRAVFFAGIGAFAEKMARQCGWWWWNERHIDPPTAVNALKTLLAKPVSVCGDCKKLSRIGHGGGGDAGKDPYWFCNRCWDNWNERWNTQKRTLRKEEPESNVAKEAKLDGDTSPHSKNQCNTGTASGSSPTASEPSPAAGSPLTSPAAGSPLTSPAAGSPLTSPAAGSPLTSRAAGSPLTSPAAGSPLPSPAVGSPSTCQERGRGRDIPNPGAPGPGAASETMSTVASESKAVLPTFTSIDFETDVVMDRTVLSTSTDPLIRMLENLAGHPVDEDFELSAMDSLRLISLVCRLRPHPWNFQGSFADIRDITNVTELRGLIATSKPMFQPCEMVQEAKLYMAPHFFRSPVSWTIQLRNPLNTAKLSPTVNQMFRSHTGLRIHLTETDEIIQFTNEASAHVRFLQSLLPEGNALGKLLVMGLFDFWPRVQVEDVKDEYPKACNIVECKDRSNMNSWLRHFSNSKNFNGPLCVSYLTVPSLDEHYLHVAVNHGMGDAGAILPLCNELLQVIDGASFKPIPDSLKLQEDRLRSALFNEDRGDSVNVSWLSPLTWRRAGAEHHIILQSGAAALLSGVASNLRIPLDQVLIALLACTLARLVLKAKPDLAFLPLKLLVPNRDGVGEQDIVGCLSSDRDLDLSLANQTLIGAMMEISSLIKARKWNMPHALDPWINERMCINLRAALTELHGGATHKVANAQDYVDLPERTRATESNLDVFADECQDGLWVCQCRVGSNLPYKAELGITFKETLQEFATSPGRRLWPRLQKVET